MADHFIVCFRDKRKHWFRCLVIEQIIDKLNDRAALFSESIMVNDGN